MINLAFIFFLTFSLYKKKQEREGMRVRKNLNLSKDTLHKYLYFVVKGHFKCNVLAIFAAASTL